MVKDRFFYGTWEGLVWCKILPRGVGTICPSVWEFQKNWKIQTLSEPFWRCLVSPAGATHFQNSNFSEPFLRCLCSPAGATHFQKSHFSEPFLRCLCSPAGATHFQKSDLSESFLRCVVSPAGATHFQKSDFSDPFFRINQKKAVHGKPDIWVLLTE